MRTIVKRTKTKPTTERADQREATVTVLGTERVSTKRIKPYRDNPRIGNIEMVAESLAKNGQFKGIVVQSENAEYAPGEILAGNHTYLAARRLGWTDILVSWVSVEEDHAKRIVLADNRTSDKGSYDEQMLQDLLQSLPTLDGTGYDNGVLEKLVKQQQEDEDPNNVEMKDVPGDDPTALLQLNPDLLFPTDEAAFGMPLLRLDMIPEELPKNLDVWAGHELCSNSPEQWWVQIYATGSRGIDWTQSILCCYTEDFHFESFYDRPDRISRKMLSLGIPMAIMPNYSQGPTWPQAVNVWASYRSFYVARYWQEVGIQVIPDLQYGTDQVWLDHSLAGIPDGCPVVSAQVQNAKGDKDAIRRIARQLRECEQRIGFKQILLYGHTDADDVAERVNFSNGVEIVRCANRTSKRREYLNAGAFAGK